MRYIVSTRNKPCTIAITIYAKRLCNLYIEAFDTDQEHTYFTQRYRSIAAGKTETLYIQMPLSPKKTTVRIVEDIAKDTSYANEDKNNPFDIVSIKTMGLNRQMDVVNMRNPNVKNFVEFAQRFCFNAGVMPTYENRYYVSDRGKFRILFTPVIADNGKEVFTPARIDKETKVIDVSKSKFIDMTVPIRFCILCHEFSHLYLNEDMYNELEADINALVIYLGLGYPRIEAKETFLSVLYQHPSDENKERYDHICHFIDNFEKEQFDHL